MNVRHHVVQHHQGRVVMSVASLDAILISTVEMDEMSTFLHRYSQVKYSYLSWSRENGFRSPRPGERAPPVPPRPSSHLVVGRAPAH